MTEGQDPRFREALARYFPGSRPEREFIAATARQLQAAGFSRENSLPCVGVCRDEIATPLINDVETIWGPAFQLASLAGMLTAGITGFGAAAHHAPEDDDGRRHLIVYAMPHIAIAGDGTIGQVERPGVPDPSTACGALIGFRKELAAGTIDVALDRLDAEQSLLKQSLIPKLTYGEVPSLVNLTRCAADAIEEDLVAMLPKLAAALGEERPTDAAIFTGIQIHGPNAANYVMPRLGRIVSDGATGNVDMKAVAAA